MQEIIQNKTFCSMMQNHLRELLGFLIKKQEPFHIIVQVKHIDANPPIDPTITEAFGEFMGLSFQNYTLESAYICEEGLCFETGFGNPPVGTKVRLPLLSIKQILHNETPLCINIADVEHCRNNNAKNLVLTKDMTSDKRPKRTLRPSKRLKLDTFDKEN